MAKKKPQPKKPAAAATGPRLRNLEVRRVRVADLADAPFNWRTHPQKQKDALAGAVDELGFAGYPDVYKAADGTLTIIDGHARKELLLAKYGPDTEIDVNVTDFNEAEARKYNLTKDPLAAMAESDVGALDSLLRECQTGSEPLAKMLEGLANEAGCEWAKPAAIVEDEVPEAPAVPVTQPEDLWLLGEHRLLCSDSTDAKAVERLFAGGRASVTITSPPYNAGAYTLTGNVQKKDKASRYAGDSDGKSESDYLDFLCGFTTAALSVSDLCAINLQQIAGNKRAIIAWAFRFNKNFVDRAIWFKGDANPAMAERVMNSRFEDFWLFSNEDKPNRAIKTADFRGTVCNVYHSKGGASSENESAGAHAATMPLALCHWAITSWSREGASLYEPFSGSGTTIIAAEQLGRRCYAMEISPQYVDVALARYSKLTGKRPTRESDGLEFEVPA